MPLRQGIHLTDWTFHKL